MRGVLFFLAVWFTEEWRGLDEDFVLCMLFDYDLYVMSCFQLSGLQKYEEVLMKINEEVTQRLQNVVPTTDIFETCHSPLVLAQQLTHIELVRLSLLCLFKIFLSILTGLITLICT